MNKPKEQLKHRDMRLCLITQLFFYNKYKISLMYNALTYFFYQMCLFFSHALLVILL